MEFSRMMLEAEMTYRRDRARRDFAAGRIRRLRRDRRLGVVGPDQQTV